MCTRKNCEEQSPSEELSHVLTMSSSRTVQLDYELQVVLVIAGQGCQMSQLKTLSVAGIIAALARSWTMM